MKTCCKKYDYTETQLIVCTKVIKIINMLVYNFTITIKLMQNYTKI